MKNFKGSQSAMLDLISSPNFFAKLAEIIDDSSVKFSLEEKHVPLSKGKFNEAELKDFLKETFLPVIGDQIRDWWLDVVKPNTRTPNWDFVSTCSINGIKGLLLIEAKAHWNEVKENDKCGSSNEKNRNKIEFAINEAKEEINRQDYLNDCILETDLALIIPDDYVNNITERLNLYTQLNNIKTEEELVPVSEVNELKRRIKQLERVLGQKTMDNEILREAVKIGREKKLISRQPLPCLEDMD